MIFADTTIVIAVSVVSSVILLVVGVAIGFYIWKHRYIQKKRRGKKLFLERCGSHGAIISILYQSKVVGISMLVLYKASKCVKIYL